MIVLDRNLYDHELVTLLDHWWHGPVVAQTDIGITKGADDPEIIEALPPGRPCVFVTGDKGGFFNRFDGKPDLCIVEIYAAKVPKERLSKVLQKLLHIDPFRPARRRSGVVIRVTQEGRDWLAHWYRSRADPDRENQVVRFRVT